MGRAELRKPDPLRLQELTLVCMPLKRLPSRAARLEQSPWVNPQYWSPRSLWRQQLTKLCRDALPRVLLVT